MAFPTFFNLSLNFAVGTHDLNHSELQVLFLLTTWSFSIFVCKEYNKSDFYIDHVMISICRVVSWVVGTWCFLWPAYSLDKTLLAFALLHFVLQGQICLLLQVSLWLPTFAFQSSIMKRTSLGGCQFYKVLQVFIEPFNFSFFSITGWDLDLDYCDIEWFALEMKRDHSVIFEIASKQCILDSFVDHVGYSISSEGFLATVVDIMVI